MESAVSWTQEENASYFLYYIDVIAFCGDDSELLVEGVQEKGPFLSHNSLPRNEKVEPPLSHGSSAARDHTCV